MTPCALVATDAVAGMIGQPVLVNENQQAAPNEVVVQPKVRHEKGGHCRTPEVVAGRDGNRKSDVDRRRP